MAGPTLLAHGTEDQKRRHLPGIILGTDAFCQLFSEPNAGSDLAGLQTRAEPDGDSWVVNGQKVWTSRARTANRAILLARTNDKVPKHSGISYFLVDMMQPGVEVRPLREMTGRSHFTEVFLSDVRVPRRDLVGGEGHGWALAVATLGFERALSGGEVIESPDPGPLAGNLERPVGELQAAPSQGPNGVEVARFGPLGALARSAGRHHDPLTRHQLTQLYALERLNALNNQRSNEPAGLEGLPGISNLAKVSQNHALRLGRDLTFTLLAASGMLHTYQGRHPTAQGDSGIADDHTELINTALFSQAAPIYGGTDQIQRNILAERVLGLPRDPGPRRDIPFCELPKN
jgi:alkylation response protein AidB-like acyl-CoA dehydrogenase